MTGVRPPNAVAMEAVTGDLQQAALDMRRLAERKSDEDALFDRLILALAAIRDEPARRHMYAEIDLCIAQLAELDERLAVIVERMNADFAAPLSCVK